MKKKNALLLQPSGRMKREEGEAEGGKEGGNKVNLKKK